ncbi:hypothetical protein DAEQUDRAFT_181156 [Daedalea quercina L-15889]|uniref:Uncharacterized protein n=1 Tax=Daedalea quercina L-15889 TaxID=1314783 RepID=A0A165REK0_9APHY|nr:hypothetical protein DAEQUDRAFT_181156 [Daedalea quercina L-15889]
MGSRLPRRSGVLSLNYHPPYGSVDRGEGTDVYSIPGLRWLKIVRTDSSLVMTVVNVKEHLDAYVVSGNSRTERIIFGVRGRVTLELDGLMPIRGRTSHSTTALGRRTVVGCSILSSEAYETRVKSSALCDGPGLICYGSPRYQDGLGAQ